MTPLMILSSAANAPVLANYTPLGVLAAIAVLILIAVGLFTK